MWIFLIIGAFIFLCLGTFVGYMLLKSKTNKKFLTGLIFCIVAMVFFFLGVISVVGINIFWEKTMKKEVRVIREIDFVKDHVFNNAYNFKPTVKGIIEKGSKGIRTFGKGRVVYISFPMVLFEEDIEYVK